MDLRVSASNGWRRSSFYFHGVARRTRYLYPLANMLRQRWSEAEKRQFEQRQGWTPRRTSTLRRYTWPITSIGGGSHSRGAAIGRGTGSFSGTMEFALTHEHQPGIRDNVELSPGEIVTDFGVKARGPIAHGNFFNEGAGSQPARSVIVWDQRAHDDATGDVQDYTGGAFFAISGGAE